MTAVDDYYSKCVSFGIVHPNSPLEAKPWRTREFAGLDPDGNLVTFAERQCTMTIRSWGTTFVPILVPSTQTLG